jgi:hypothetical protein
MSAIARSASMRICHHHNAQILKRECRAGSIKSDWNYLRCIIAGLFGLTSGSTV